MDVAATDPAIAEVLARYWGFDRLRPLQGEAIPANLDGEDSLLVMPTGGGKSLTYQVPPLLAESLDVVVSPLVALMKDQVDGLREAGIPAVAFDGSLTASERSRIRSELEDGAYRLLFLSPEMLLGSSLPSFLRNVGVRAVAIHEWRSTFKVLSRSSSEPTC